MRVSTGVAGLMTTAGLHFVMRDLLEGAVKVAADLLVDGHHVGAGFGEGFDEVVGIFHHHVAVEGEFCDRAEGLDHGRAEGDVGDEVAVHDVDVDDGAATALGCCDVVGEVGEVGGEDGECQFNHLGSAPAASLSVEGTLNSRVPLSKDLLAQPHCLQKGFLGIEERKGIQVVVIQQSQDVDSLLGGYFKLP